MPTMGLSDLYNAAKDEDVLEDGDFWSPDEGQQFLAEVIKANTGTTKKGIDRFGLFWKVLDGPDAGKAFWDNIYMSDNPKANARSFAKMAVVGISDALLSSDPSAAAVAEVFVGQQATINCKYQTPGDKDSFKNFKYIPVEKAEEVYVVPEEEDPAVPEATDDTDLDF